MKKRQAARRLAYAKAAVVVFALPLSAVGATPTASLSIDSVGGKPVVDGRVKEHLTGTVAVSGRASLAHQETAPVVKPLVADAGDSAYAPTGTQAPLLGAGFGGTEPYRFSWTSATGEIEGTDAATAGFTGATGVHTVTLTVTDAAGATATDTVKVIGYDVQNRTLLDRTQLDPTPGFESRGAPGLIDMNFDVPAGTSRLEVTLTYKVPTNDYDLKLVAPRGPSPACSCNFVTPIPRTTERVTVQAPVDGNWTARIEKYTTVADEFRLVARAVVATGGNATDPRPTVDSGGPYAFVTGATQTLDGTVGGGTAPLAVAWDLDHDGVFETQGADVTASLPEGKHVVTLKATDANGYERRETTVVTVADTEALAHATTPVTVIAINDTGINPYHLEFAASTYPDPEVLALTRNFTRHPSEYIPGYPTNTPSLPVTLGRGYFPQDDEWIWGRPRVTNLVTGAVEDPGVQSVVQPNQLYWIPGTKIVGALDPGGSTGVTSGDDTHPILDDNGHGSGSASVSAGNRYGYCPTCLLVVVEALDASVAANYSWVDFNSNSWGTVGGAPTGVLGGEQSSRTAVERGQTVLFAAGNGVGNAFDVPQVAYGSRTVGPDWNVVVGAIRRDNQRAIVGDSIPVHISAWGDGNLPSACRTGTVGQCAFGGTSAATPYTAGVFGTVLTEVRRAVGDVRAGQKPGQVVAQGAAVTGSTALDDGKLTRAELREAVLKTAFPLNQGNAASPYPYPATAPYAGEANVFFEGYGAATPTSARRAIDVLLGRAPMPARPFEDSFFRLDRYVRDRLYGGYDRDGDGTRDVSQPSTSFTLPEVDLNTVTGAVAALQAAAAAETDTTQVERPIGANPLTFFLHRAVSSDPGASGCGATKNELFMDHTDTGGDLEPCFESRITSVPAAYRPIGIFPSKATLTAPLPAGSTVHVELYLTTETPSVVRPSAVLVATDREIGTGRGPLQPVVGSGPTGAACGTAGEGCWTKYAWSFVTTRPAFTGEHLTFQVQFLGTRSTAFGLEGAHASKLVVSPAPLPSTGLTLGVTVTEPADGAEVVETDRTVVGGQAAFPDLGSDPTGAGAHPTSHRVEVSVDDASFAKPVKATLDAGSGTWSATLGRLTRGEHTLYARAATDSATSDVVARPFRVVADARVEWQVVRKNQAANAGAWRRAAGLETWSFGFDAAAYGNGPHTVIVRLVERGDETAQQSVRVVLR